MGFFLYRIPNAHKTTKSFLTHSSQWGEMPVIFVKEFTETYLAHYPNPKCMQYPV